MKDIIKKYFEENSIVESNIKSYNNFVEKRLQLIIDDINKNIPKEEGIDLRLSKITIGKPKIVEVDGSEKDLLPFEARIRRLTYAAPVFLEIHLVRGNEKEFFNAQICKLPVMVKSKYCHLNGLGREKLVANYEDPNDPGGYFILNGNERVLVLVEDLAPNQPFIEKTAASGVSMRLFSEKGSYRIPLSIHESKDGELEISFTRFKNLPLIPLIKSLGLVKDVDIMQAIGKEYDSIIVNLYEFAELKKEDDAIMLLAERMNMQGNKSEIIDRVQGRIDNFLLPHIGMGEKHRIEKATTLCKLIKQLLIVQKESKSLDDKDHYMNKRIRLSGDLLTDLFRINLSIFIRDMQHTLQRLSKRRRIYSAKSIVKSALLSRRIESSMSTGSWIGEKKGLTQNIQRTNYLDLYSQLQRVISLLPTEQENFKARTLHPTHYGRLCPIETPEGTSIGLRKNLALLARISTATDFDDPSIIEVLKEVKSEIKKMSFPSSSASGDESKKGNTGSIDIFLNGKFVLGIEAAEAVAFSSNLREKRRTKQLPLETSVYYDPDKETIFISTEVGRVLRPLIVVKNGNSLFSETHTESLKHEKLTWQSLIDQGVIEYIDAAEEENALVAFYPQEITIHNTHVEIHPIVQNGLTTSLVPYGNFCQSARLNRGSKTQKQSLGLYAANFPVRLDTDISLLHYPQRPIVRSFIQDIVDYYPAGQNVVVAILCYEGYNMQDAIVMNKSSVDRGLARSSYFRPYETEELHYAGGLADEITIPTKEVVGYKTENSYRLLEDDGIVSLEANASETDVVIGKTSPPKFLTEVGEISMAKIRKESSLAIRQEEKGIIDSIFVSVSEGGHKRIQVRTRDSRVPEIGDKFSTRHGQKGVISLLVPEEDMPFTSRGVRPDIMFNPHSLPSRMTVSHLIEMLAGKVGCLQGRKIDATAFEAEPVELLESQLKTLGFREDGKEILYDGITGRMMEAKIYIGNMYYLKLEYMVANKLHARAFGKITLLTRQPVEGKSKGGALRLGEMEKDALVGHGASLLLKERYDSDKVIAHICEKDGVFAVYNYVKDRAVCPICGTSAHIQPIEISYAFKLLLEELSSMHIFSKIVLKSKYE